MNSNAHSFTNTIVLINSVLQCHCECSEHNSGKYRKKSLNRKSYLFLYSLRSHVHFMLSHSEKKYASTRIFN
jgi:hypothetical protein